jgi:ketopantoate reductase
MLNEANRIAMIGAGAIGGITAALIRESGRDLEIGQ